MDTIDNILALMSERGVTAAQLTREAGITNGLITQWKKRLQKPSAENVAKIAAFFGVTTDYLLGRVDDLRVEVIPADPEEVRAHEEWLDQQRDASFRQLVDVIKKLPPDGEQPFTEEDLEIMRKVNNLSPENRARALDYLALLENQDNS